MGFPDNLRRLRLEQFLSQAELARRAGLHALTITRLEGGTTAPSTRTVRGLAQALTVEPRELATPHEVAELRRVLGQPPQTDGKVIDRLDSWDDDGGAAEPGLAARQTEPAADGNRQQPTG
jgi:transcriptional regulator with XRE-family HTH domain